MARHTLQPAPSPLVGVKREEPDAAAASPHTPAPRSRKRRRLGGGRRKVLTPTPLSVIPPVTPQTIPSGSTVAGQTPATAAASVKLKTDSDASAGAGRWGPRDLDPWQRPAAAEPPSLWLNRCRLLGILRELVRAHRWRDAAGVVSALLRAPRKPGSFEETRTVFVMGLEIHKRLAKDKGTQQGRANWQYKTIRLFHVWIKKQIWFPACPKKELITLELALFHLSQGDVDAAYNATRILFGKGLKTESILNLIHGLISYDKWYSGLPKDMQVEGFDFDNESHDNSMVSAGFEESDVVDNSDDNSISVHGTGLPSCSSSVNNEDMDRKMDSRRFLVHPKEEDGTPNESTIDNDFRSIFLNTSDGPTCGLDKDLLPLQLNPTTGTSNHCFDSYWRYKSVPNYFYEEATKHLRLALHSNPPVEAALLPLIQLLLLGDKLKDALNELEMACSSSNTALSFRLRGRLLEHFDQNQVSTISSCYEDALRRDPTCSYSIERLITMHRKGLYNTIQLFDSIVVHLDSSNGKPCIWEGLASCFLRLFSDWSADYEDCISCTSVQGDKVLRPFSKICSVFPEPFTRESWKARCRWWRHHHFSQNIFMSETLKGDCKLLAAKAACASHLFGPEYPYVKAVGNYLAKQEEAADEISFVVRNKQNSVRLLKTLETLTS